MSVPSLDWDEPPRSIHLIGVAGSVMGGLACLLASRGHRVRGSDRDCYPPMSDRLAAAGVPVTLGFAARNLKDDPPDLVVVGNITRRDNPEAAVMRRLGLPHVSLPELLCRLFLRRRPALTVAGTHGKTTTSSMVAWLLQRAGREPGMMIGGAPMGFDSGFRAGDDRAPFVLEADEYDTAYFDKRPKFVHYLPRAGVLTSLEFDHADIYPDLEAVRRSFRTYARLFEGDAPLWVHGPDAEARAAAAAGRARVLTYGLEDEVSGADAMACGLRLAREAAPSRFAIRLHGRDEGDFELPMAGRHNIRNALAAYALCRGQGVSASALREGLATFGGVRRRQELRGEPRGITVLQDYAHHPTAVRETLAAIRARFPGRRLWGLFEAESNTSRRHIFQLAYVDAFADADEVIFVRPLAKDDALAAAERLDPDRLAGDLGARGVRARFIPDPDDIAMTLQAEARPGDILLFMSGRDFLGLPARMAAELEAPDA